jgi:two-component system, NarL family, nitrate/nitrite response regulator NarL
MNTQHFFFSSDIAAVPQRWRQAFATGEALDAPALLTRLQGQPAQQCMVWLTAGNAQWPDILRQVLQAQPGARIVLLSGAPDPQEGLQALNLGVRGYAHAYAVPALLQEVATVVDHGGLWVGPDLLLRLVGATQAALAKRATPEADAPVATAAPANPWDLLSAREAQVARAVCAGRSNKEVADLMFISERTVKAHMGAVFEKLGVRDRLQLVLRLAGFPDPGPVAATESLS